MRIWIKVQNFVILRRNGLDGMMQQLDHRGDAKQNKN